MWKIRWIKINPVNKNIESFKGFPFEAYCPCYQKTASIILSSEPNVQATKNIPRPEWRTRNGWRRGQGQGNSHILTCKTCWMLRSQETQCCWNISVELSPTSKDSRQRPSNLMGEKWVVTSRWRLDFRESYLLLFHSHWTTAKTFPPGHCGF